VNATDGFTSSGLLKEELLLTLPKIDVADALEIGQIAASLGENQRLPISAEVRLGDWIIYHASLPGSTVENQGWIDRKTRFVMLKHHSILFERVSSQERGVDWFEENNLTESTHSIHGGGLPLIPKVMALLRFYSDLILTSIRILLQ
jgi:uncharacterized protein (UPF0303 family)